MTRSRATAKKAGTSWETAIKAFLIEQGWPHVERRARTGGKDQGDLTGIPGLVIEAKNVNRFALSGWVKEAKAEAANAGAETWCVWIKKDGKTSPGDGYVVMDGRMFAHLIREAGY